jgi:hypothetical protein
MIIEKNKKPSIFLPGFSETFIGNTIFLYHEAPLRHGRSGASWYRTDEAELRGTERTKRSFVVQNERSRASWYRTNEAELRGTERTKRSFVVQNSIKLRQIKCVNNRQ